MIYGITSQVEERVPSLWRHNVSALSLSQAGAVIKQGLFRAPLSAWHPQPSASLSLCVWLYVHACVWVCVHQFKCLPLAPGVLFLMTLSNRVYSIQRNVTSHQVETMRGRKWLHLHVFISTFPIVLCVFFTCLNTKVSWFGSNTAFCLFQPKAQII